MQNNRNVATVGGEVIVIAVARHPEETEEDSAADTVDPTTQSFECSSIIYRHVAAGKISKIISDKLAKSLLLNVTEREWAKELSSLRLPKT